MRRHRSSHRRPGVGPTLALAFLTLPAVAPALSDGGPYVGVEAGAGLKNTQNFADETQGAPASDSAARFGTGFAGRAVAGYSLANVLRPEVELGFQHKNGTNSGISENAYTAMGNLWVDLIHQHGYFVDFGAGVGLLDAALRRDGAHDSAVSGAWQLGAGAGVDLTPHLALATEFRRLAGFDRASYRVQPDERLRTRFATNAVLLELRYSFAGTASDSILDRLTR